MRDALCSLCEARTACRVRLTISSSIASPASTSSSSVMRGLPLRRASPSRAERRDVHERGQPQMVVGADRLDRAPAQIIAEIASGVARGRASMPVPSAARSSSQRMRAEPHRVRAGGDRSLADAGLRRIGPQHGDGVAGAGLDPDMRGAAGEAEHQQRLRAVFCQRLRQFAVDRLVGHGKDVAGQFDVGEAPDGAAASAASPAPASDCRARPETGRSR